jgi:hypothetical protein
MWVGQGIAFAALTGAAAWLEISGKNANGLWILVAIWVVFGKWNPSDKDDGR